MKKMGLPPEVVLKMLCVGTVLLSMLGCSLDGEDKGLPPRPIPNGLLFPSEALKLTWTSVFGRQETESTDCEDFSRYHPPTYSKPILHAAIPQHPFMAANPGSNMHCDAYMSDTYEAIGPLGLDPQVSSRTQGFGGYGTLAYDSTGRLVGVYSNGRGFALHLLNPYTLEKRDAFPLPSRSWSFLFQGVLPWKYIGAGTYFYLDHQDRAIVPTTDNAILVVQVPAPVFRIGRIETVRRLPDVRHPIPVRVACGAVQEDDDLLRRVRDRACGARAVLCLHLHRIALPIFRIYLAEVRRGLAEEAIRLFFDGEIDVVVRHIAGRRLPGEGKRRFVHVGLCEC